MATRRQVDQWTGVGTVASLTVGGGLRQDFFIAAEQDRDSTRFRADVRSGNRIVHLQEVPARQGVGHDGPARPETHLLEGLSPAAWEHAATDRRDCVQGEEGGHPPYACGVINMHQADDVQRAFEYAKAGGMRIIVAAPSYSILPLIGEKVREYNIRVAIHNHGPGDKFFPLPKWPTRRPKASIAAWACASTSVTGPRRRRSKPCRRTIRRPAVRHSHEGRIRGDGEGTYR